MDIRTRRQLVLLAVAAMMALAAVLALSARTSPPRFHELSNRGRQVDLQAIPPRERAWLAGQGYSTDVWLLGERGAMRFYLGAGQSSRVRCYITGIVTGRGERFDGLGCPAAFPSDEQPILDYSWYRQGLEERYPTITRLAGFAADGVAAVGVRDPGGGMSWTPVVDNVFSASPSGRAAAIVARSDDGGIVYTASLGAGTSPADGYGG